MGVVNLTEAWSKRRSTTGTPVEEWTSISGWIAETDTPNEDLWDVRDYCDTNGPTNDGPLTRGTFNVVQKTDLVYEVQYQFLHPKSSENDPQQNPTDPGELSFTTQGGSFSTRYSLETMEGKSNQQFGGNIEKGSDLDFRQGLNWDAETKSPQAVEFPQTAGLLGYTIKKLFADPLPCSYLEIIRDAGLTTNDAAYGCFAKDEVLFLGVTGAQQGSADWELHFSFSVAKNLVGLTVADPVLPGLPGQVITYDKKGHEYAWTYYNRTIMASADVNRPKVVTVRPAVYVERMYEPSNFTLLGAE